MKMGHGIFQKRDSSDSAFAVSSGMSAQVPVVLPLHPRARKELSARVNLASLLRNVRVLEPVSYLQMLVLEREASLVITDSGGVQKEAFFHGVRVANEIISAS